MTASTPVSPRLAAPAPQPSINTRWDNIFTPGGSSVIEGNLLRVLENREHRIYGAFLTGLTAVRSGVEIIPAVGKLLLNSATWFVDVTSPRGEGVEIFKRDIANVIHCVKTTVALPFFAIAGLIFPKDVFGLFANMPGIQTKVAILDGKAVLADLKVKRDSEERKLTAAEDELVVTRKDLHETNEALTATKAQLEAAQQKIESSKGASIEAERLSDLVSELGHSIRRLRGEAGTATDELVKINGEITRLGPELNIAKASNASALESLERQRAVQEETLKGTKNLLEQTVAKQEAAQADLDRLTTANKDLTTKTAALNAEVERLQKAKPGLEDQERGLLANIQSHKNELLGLEAQLSDAKEKTRLDLEGLKQQITDQKSAISERSAKIERLNREQTALEERRKGLDAQCRELEFTTLHGLNDRKKALGTEIKSLEEQKASLRAEMAAQEEALRTEKETAKTLATRKHELTTTIAGLELQASNFRDTLLPELETEVNTVKQRKAAVEAALLVEQEKLNDIKTRQASARGELESATKKLTAKKDEHRVLERSLQSIAAQLKKGSPVKDSAGASSSDSSQIISDLKKELDALGTSIVETTTQNTALIASLADQESTLRAKKETADRLTKESSSLNKNIEHLKSLEEELKTGLLRLSEEIKKLEAKEKTLQGQNAALYDRVKASTASLEELSAQHRTVEAEGLDAGKKKTANEKALTGLSDQIAVARREKSEIQGEIDGLRTTTDSMKTVLAGLETEKANLDGAITQLTTEKQALTRQINDTTQELDHLKDTLALTKETHAAQMKALVDERAQVSREVADLKVELQTTLADRDALKREFDQLTASTAELRSQNAVLQESNSDALAAQQAIIRRTAHEIEAFQKLQPQTQALSAQVQKSTQELAHKTAAIRQLDVEFATRRAAFEEELRQKAQTAETAQRARLEEIRQNSPAKAKLASIASPSVLATPGTMTEDLRTVEAKLKQRERALERADKALSDREAKIAEMQQLGDTLKKSLLATKDRLNGENAALRIERDRLREEARKLQIVINATPAKTAVINSEIATK